MTLTTTSGSRPASTSLFSIFDTDKNLFGLILCWLDPKELINFAWASEKCHQIIQWYNPLGRLERACGFAKIIIEPCNQYRTKRYSELKKIAKQRVLAPEEQKEMLQLAPGWTLENSSSHREIAILNPRPMELFRAFPQTPNNPAGRLIFGELYREIPPAKSQPSSFSPTALISSFTAKKTVTVDETRACYTKLNQVIFSLMEKMTSKKNANYTPLVERIKSLASKVPHGQQVPNFVIEEAIWSILSLFKGEEISPAEEDCKKLIQNELSKFNRKEIEEIEKNLEATFDTFKPLYRSCLKIILNQKRQKHFEQLAQNDEVRSWRGIIRLVCAIPFARSIAVQAVKCPKFLPPSWQALLEVATCIFATCITVFPTPFLPWFPIRAEIRDEEGVETIQYTAHPLRSRIHQCCDLLLVSSTVITVGTVALKLLGVESSFIDFFLDLSF